FFALRPAPAGALREVWRSTVQNSQIYCRLPLANEFLADVGEVSLFEQGTAAIAAGLRRDGVDAEALAVLRDGRRERPDIGTLTLAIRLGILRQDPILEHLATTLATAGQDSDGRSGPLRRG